MKRNNNISTHLEEEETAALFFLQLCCCSCVCSREGELCSTHTKATNERVFECSFFGALFIKSSFPLLPSKKKTKLHSLIYTQTEVLPGNTKKIALVIVRRARGLGYGHLAHTPPIDPPVFVLVLLLFYSGCI